MATTVVTAVCFSCNLQGVVEMKRKFNEYLDESEPAVEQN